MEVVFQNEGSRFDWSCSHFTLQKDNKNKNKSAYIQLIEQGQPCPTATFDIDTIEASFHDQQFTHP
jgi:hypothetical protein